MELRTIIIKTIILYRVKKIRGDDNVFKNKKLSLLLVAIMVFSMMLTGCQGGDEAESGEVEAPAVEEQEVNEESPEVEEVEEVEEEVQLSDWDGTWNNMGAYLDDEELEEAFVELGEREGMSPEEAKKEFAEGGKINFDGLVIQGDKVTLLDGPEDKGGQVIKELEYNYKDSITVKHGNFDTEWFAFESQDEGEYKNLLMMPVHGEEALTHFHLRYGEDLDEILADEEWYPVLVKPNSTYDQLYEEVTE